MIQEHTPGPWVIGQNRGPLFVAAMTDRNGRIATIADNPTDQLIACANARLIAAAPELLCMLRRLLDEVMTSEEVFSKIAALTLEQSRAAIVKAEGAR